MRINNFEEIEAWKKSRELTKIIYRLSSKSEFSKDWLLKDQIRRAVIFVGSNIAEGFDSGFNKEFARFLNISKRSVSEIQSQLYVALDQLYINHKEFECAYDCAQEIRKIISGFIRYLKSTDESTH